MQLMNEIIIRRLKAPKLVLAKNVDNASACRDLMIGVEKYNRKFRLGSLTEPQMTIMMSDSKLL